MLLPLIVIPILSRLYTPVDYANWGVFSSVLFIVNSFLCLSYENAIIRTNKRESVSILVILCISIALIVSLIVGICFTAGQQLGFKFFVEFPSVSLLVLTLFLTAIHNTLLCVANNDKRYSLMFFINVTNGFTQAVIRIMLGVFPVISLGLIWGNFIGHFVSAVFLFVFLHGSLRFCQKDISYSGIKLVAKEYEKFPRYDAPAKFLEFTVGNIVIIILSHFFAKEEIGCYSMIMTFLLSPIAVIGSAMGNVYYREISQNREADFVKGVTTKVLKITFFLSLLPILFINLGGDYLLTLFLGSKWEAAGKMAIIMSIFSLPIILSEPLLPAFRALDRQEYRLQLNIVNLVLSIGALVISSIFINNIYTVLLFYSVVYAMVRFIFFYIVLKITGVNSVQVIKIYIPVIVIVYLLVVVRVLIEGLII